MDNNFIALKTIDLLKKSHFDQIESILINLKTLAEEFIKIKKEYFKPFNIILASSDIYYRENYHSDIMAYILKNKPDTIEYFIEYINGIPDIPKIDKNNYLKIEVKREEENIDILIKDLTSRHCIIVENKIYNARDMPRQLPNYYLKCKENGYEVDGILYYSLDGKKPLDKSTWNDEDKQLGLDSIIVDGAAANRTKTDYINAFLIKCKNNTENEQEKAFYCQYIDLLEYLRRNQMDYQLMEKFYKEMLDPKQYESALSIKNMFDDFIEFRRNRIRDQIRDHFQTNYSPFETPIQYSTYGMAYSFIRDIDPEEDIRFEILPEQKQTKIVFRIEKPKIESDLIEKILKKIGEYDKFTKKDKNFYLMEFKFPEKDEEMYKYIENFFLLLKKNKDIINSCN